MNLLCPLKTRLYILEDRDKKMSKTKENGMNETRVSRNFHEDARFTLVELLVVMAILSILVSLVMQSLRTGMEAARIIACATNLKQIGNATSLYLNDDNERRYPARGNKWEGYGWDDLLSQYDGRNLTVDQMTWHSWGGREYGNMVSLVPNEGQNHGQMYRCPSDSREWIGENAEYVKKTYSPSGLRWGQSTGLGIIGNEWGSWVSKSRSESLLPRPSGTIAFTEELTFANGYGPGLRARMGNCYDHLGFVPDMYVNNNDAHGKSGLDYNYLMADGHVETLLFIETLVRDDGSTAISSDVRNTKWDASPDRR